jgi:hypothetical protein
VLSDYIAEDETSGALSAEAAEHLGLDVGGEPWVLTLA